LKKDPNQEEKQTLNSYIKYSSLAFQMIAIIAIFSFIGVKIDHHQNMTTPIYTAALSLTGVMISIVMVFRSLK
jgi:ATP synthase protein I